MTSTTPASRAWPRTLWLIAFVLAFDLAFFWQRAGGAYRSEFGGHPDEAGHVVTGLFVRDALVFGRDWVLQGAHGSPIQAGKEFADDYYAHYPKIGLGVWPPFFYLVQAAWTFLLPPARLTLLWLMAALAATAALLFGRALREEYGRASAVVAAALLLSLPLVRGYYGMVMAETLSAVLMFGAMLAFGSFLDRGERRAALWFGVLAALAILTKGTGLAIMLAAPLAFLGTRKFHLLRRPALWAAVAIIGLFAGPWTWATRHLGKGGWLQPEPSWSFTLEALPYYAGKLGHALGWVIVPLMFLGLWVKLRKPGPTPGRWAAVGALLASVPVFQSIAPVGLEARHLIPALPAALMFAVAGAHWMAERFAARWSLAAIAVVAFASIVLPVTEKGFSGFAPMAVEALHEAGPAEITLVSSDAAGEGMFISEMALRERRPGHVIRRASKDLASSTWSGSGYQPAFAKDDDLLAFLTAGKDIAYRYLVLDDTVPPAKRREHQNQIKRLVEEHPEHFRLLASAEVMRSGVLQSTPARLYKIQRKN
jgi:hypothetical protein